ncbi:hypothetical protein [Streptomyces lydicus]|uniref:hypothetical protein n=1 Tax=Streptomyces lydicus TaxID=47763 RepID=UPI0036EB2048
MTYQSIEPGQMRAELTWINGDPGVVCRGPDRVVATLTFDLHPEGRISTIHNVANPDKLHAVADGARHEFSCPARPLSPPSGIPVSARARCRNTARTQVEADAAG